MPDSHDRVTIKDVAAQAGVSVATISRVLNGKGPVREATSRRVIETCQALRFTPHGVARSLSIRRTHTIGLLLPDLHGEFFSEVIRGIDAEARRSGYHLLVSGFHSDRQEMIAVFRAVRGRVDSLIVMSPDREASALCAYLPAGFPIVLLNNTGVSRDISIDNYGGAEAMVRHLRGLGHTRIAFIKGPDQNADAAERLRGYRDTSPQAIEFDGNFSEEAGYDAGIRVPHDIALAGFDDIPTARYVTPPLTTVNVPIAELGRRAFDLAISDEEQHHEVLQTTLVIRESCGSTILRGGTKS